MKLLIQTYLLALSVFLISNFSLVNAQINDLNSVTSSGEILDDIKSGEEIYLKFQNKEINCASLKKDDFEKIGEYIMDTRFVNKEQHIQMNENMNKAMGDEGEEQIHIDIARGVTGCNNRAQSQNVKAMNNKNMAAGMMSKSYFKTSNILENMFWMVAIIDGILLGVWLFQKIKKN